MIKSLHFLSLTILLIVFCPITFASERVIVIQKNDFSHGSGELGNFKALVIGINKYMDNKITNLDTAVADAQGFAKVIREKYGFSTKLLLTN